MTRKKWIAVASAEHARLGRHSIPGFMQVNHGKLAPLKRIQPGDLVAYYSPSVVRGVKDAFQSFVSIGVVQPGQPYTGDMGNGFVPYRRDVAYVQSKEASILPLLDDLEFVEDRQRWGYKFRFGLFQVSDHDMRLIARVMQADPALLQLHG
ncbi:MAG: EVE domain-containing protein [Pseudomonadota bacterium]